MDLAVAFASLCFFAFNVSGSYIINLFVISSTTSGTIGWFTLSGVVYKNLNALEVSFILNLGIGVCYCYLHVTQSGGDQAVITYTSIGIAFLVFVGIIIKLP